MAYEAMGSLYHKPRHRYILEKQSNDRPPDADVQANHAQASPPVPIRGYDNVHLLEQTRFFLASSPP